MEIIPNEKTGIVLYGNLLNDIKTRIRQAQVKATLSANAEMIMMYWDVGRMIHERQQQEGWSASIIPRLSRDLRNELPEVKGFSERNLGRMLAFFRNYQNIESFLPQPVAKSEILHQPVAKLPSSDLIRNIPWGHHALLMEKIKENSVRFWYMTQIIQNGWSRDTLGLMIKSGIHERQGKSITNFRSTLPDSQSDLARQSLKDPYIFDFMTLTEPFNERELETELIKHLEKFLLELGTGFAFVGRQYHLAISDKDFYIDLLFYHLKLRSFIVIELKKGDFKPEYAGKMNFYCSAVDDLLRHPTDNATIGLILCQTKDRILAEYALWDIHKPIGISEYELTRALPENLRSSLPSIEELEAELGGIHKEDSGDE
ncbi:MAG: PDDEXK nuclease domain-containing protein [Candidatus Methanoperedens sp.]|nr:PDDEXK nuclease domain-containing protein [Candidatus Methanoperedens sp.]